MLVTPALLLLLYVAYQFDVLARLYQWGVEHRGWQVAAHRPPIATTTTYATTAAAAAQRHHHHRPTAAVPPSPPLVQNVNVFKFGSDSIGICEAGGRRIVERVFEAQQKAYAATSRIQTVVRRRSSATADAAAAAAAGAAAADGASAPQR